MKTYLTGGREVYLFQSRQFEWLAAFAAANLTPLQSNRLAAELVTTNPNFNRAKFLARVQERTAPNLIDLYIAGIVQDI